jgi:hypothetical protein
LTLDVDRSQALVATVRRLAIATFRLGAVLGLGWLATRLRCEVLDRVRRDA